MEEGVCVKYMMLEEELTLGGRHIMQHIDDEL